MRGLLISADQILNVARGIPRSSAPEPRIVPTEFRRGLLIHLRIDVGLDFIAQRGADKVSKVLRTSIVILKHQPAAWPLRISHPAVLVDRCGPTRLPIHSIKDHQKHVLLLAALDRLALQAVHIGLVGILRIGLHGVLRDPSIQLSYPGLVSIKTPCSDKRRKALPEYIDRDQPIRMIRPTAETLGTIAPKSPRTDARLHGDMLLGRQGVEPLGDLHLLRPRTYNLGFLGTLGRLCRLFLAKNSRVFQS